MIKRTLCFTSPAYLSLRDAQLVIKLPEVEKSNLPDCMKKNSTRTIPVEDIGVVVLDNRQITLTHGLLEALLENNCAVVTCDSRGMPVGLMLPLCGNTLQSERFSRQIEASLPLKKQLWQQTVKAKIDNQTAVLGNISGIETGCMKRCRPTCAAATLTILRGVPQLITGNRYSRMFPGCQVSPAAATACRPTIFLTMAMPYCALL